MGWIMSAVRSLLSNPSAYRVFRSLVARRTTGDVLRTHTRPSPGMRVLDIGCGPGSSLEWLPHDVEYTGFDLSQAYIDTAIKRYGGRGTFICESITGFLARDLPAFDVAVAVGVVHHLGDADARELFELALKALAPGGRLVAFDGCFVDEQSRLARLLLRWDRGRHVRRPSEYVALAATVFRTITSEVRHDLLRVPYTHHIMACTKDEGPPPRSAPSPRSQGRQESRP